ncbi:MAG: amino acid carrier protein [Holosporales bacterium]|jgi:AGCS family alanine or glycine:cation symporter|nr:amino acid carrier protein [Holosporales bacterium]
MLRVLDFLETLLWGYIDFAAILAVGLYFTCTSKFFQFRTILKPRETFKAIIGKSEKVHGVHPLRLYFSSMGGSIGIGNVGSCITAVSIGGPGGLFWIWIAVFIGMLVKYAEIFLGIKYRTRNENGGYDGGAPHYLVHAFHKKWISTVFCILLCIYGVEIYQFKVVEDTFVDVFGINRHIAMCLLLVGTLYVALGGVRRLSIVCSILMPFFLLMYIGVSLYVIICSDVDFFSLLKTIVISAFQGHAPLGGFAGSTFMMAVHNGMSRAVYSGDIGIGYDAVIQAETKVTDPYLQARTSVFSLFSNCTICTLTILLVLSTGQWCLPHKTPFDCVVAALSSHLPHVQFLMALFFFLAGWTTVIGYLAVGMKSVKSISNRMGQKIYLTYATIAFVAFSFLDQSIALTIMTVSGGLLLLINLFGIFKLRREVQFLENSS